MLRKISQYHRKKKSAVYLSLWRYPVCWMICQVDYMCEYSFKIMLLLYKYIPKKRTYTLCRKDQNSNLTPRLWSTLAITLYFSKNESCHQFTLKWADKEIHEKQTNHYMKVWLLSNQRESLIKIFLVQISIWSVASQNITILTNANGNIQYMLPYS